MAGKPNYRKQIRSWESEGFEITELRREFEKSRKRNKISILLGMMVMILGFSFYGYHLWKQNELRKHIIEAEHLLDQKKYTEALKIFEEASQYGSKEKSEKLASLKLKFEDYVEAIKIKEEMGQRKAEVDLPRVKKFHLEERYQFLLSDEQKGLELFQTNRFREAKDVFQSIKEGYADLSSNVTDLQNAEQERVEVAEIERVEREKKDKEKEKEKRDKERADRLKQEASKSKQEMESIKRLIDIPLAKRHIRDEFEAVIFLESRGAKAFESGKYEDAKGLFQWATGRYSELVEKIGGIRRAEEERAEKESAEKERVEHLKQEATKARSEMENAKINLDLRLVEKFGLKKEYQSLQSQELNGKELFEKSQYRGARDHFKHVQMAYEELHEKVLRLQKVEMQNVENEKLRQKALKAKADMELVKRSLDMNMIQKYKAKSEYDSLVNKEREGKRCLEDGKFEEARNIFEEINKGYAGIHWQKLRTRYQLNIVPESVNFGRVPVLGWIIGGKRSKTIWVTNKGTQSVGIKGATIDSPIQGEFHFSFWVNQGCLHPQFERHYLILNPGESCKQDIDFTPKRLGVRSANLTILLDDPDSTRMRILMVGQGM